VAVYVIGIVLLMAGVVIEGTRNAREKAALARQSAERMAANTRVDAGRQLLKARLQAHWSLGYLAEPRLLRLAELQTATLAIDDTTLRITAEDAELRPDANLLVGEEWLRLLLAYGVAPDTAGELAQRLLQLKRRLGKFQHVTDFTDSPFLPASATEGTTTLPPWRELFSIGTNSKRLHLRDAPLPLYAAMLGAGPEQLGRWRDIRSSRQPTLADAELIFGADARNVCYEGEMQMLRLRVTAGVVGDERDLLARIDKGKLVVDTP
jgi:hypothetical protein